MKQVKSYSFFIAALISLFSFVTSVAIAFLLFSNAGEYSHQSQNKTMALSISQQMLARQKIRIDEMSARQLESLLQEQYIEEQVEHIWDGKARTFETHVTISGEKKARGILVNIDIAVQGQKLNGEKKELVSFHTKMYRNV